MEKKTYEKPELTEHGKVEELTGFLGGEKAEYLFSTPTISSCHDNFDTAIYSCADIAS